MKGWSSKHGEENDVAGKKRVSIEECQQPPFLNSKLSHLPLDVGKCLFFHTRCAVWCTMRRPEVGGHLSRFSS
jgi:hypothetical protein